MTTIEYLRQTLDRLAVQFPNVQIRYAYNSKIETHIVEITPEIEYYNNPAIDDSWIYIYLEFSKKFPNENISFISSDSSLAIENAEEEWNCNKFIHLDLITEEFYAEFGVLQNEIQNMSFPSNFISEPTQKTNFTYSIQVEAKISVINPLEKAPNSNIQYAMAA